MDSETILASCLAAFISNPFLYIFAAVLQNFIELFFAPLAGLGIAAPDVFSALTGVTCAL